MSGIDFQILKTKLQFENYFQNVGIILNSVFEKRLEAASICHPSILFFIRVGKWFENFENQFVKCCYHYEVISYIWGGCRKLLPPLILYFLYQSGKSKSVWFAKLKCFCKLDKLFLIYWLCWGGQLHARNPCLWIHI